MLRRLFTMSSVVSAVLCVAAAVFWVRSYFRVDVPMRTDMWPDGGNWYWQNRQARSSDGGVMLIVSGYLVNSPGFADLYSNKPGDVSWTVFPAGSKSSPREPFPRSHWFSFDSARRPAPSRLGPEVIHSDSLGIRVPYWSVVLLTAALPLVLLGRYRRERILARPGLCPACGYDLRGTPNRCPECGRVPSTAVLR